MCAAKAPDTDTVPSLVQCLSLMRAMAMPDHIAAHSIRVAQVAELIAGRLTPPLDAQTIARIRAGALLHDITKARSFTSGEVHSRTGASLVTDCGYSPIAPMVGQHVRLDRFDPDAPVSAEEIVNYADKRVLHDRITDLNSRMRYIAERYGGSPEAEARIAGMQTQALALEEKLFARLPFAPHAVSARVCEARFQRWMDRFRSLPVSGPAPGAR